MKFRKTPKILWYFIEMVKSCKFLKFGWALLCCPRVGGLYCAVPGWVGSIVLFPGGWALLCSPRSKLGRLKPSFPCFFFFYAPPPSLFRTPSIQDLENPEILEFRDFSFQAWDSLKNEFLLRGTWINP